MAVAAARNSFSCSGGCIGMFLALDFEQLNLPCYFKYPLPSLRHRHPLTILHNSPSTERAIKSQTYPRNISSTVPKTPTISRTRIIMCGTTVQSRMSCHHFYLGYRPSIRAYGITTSKSGVSGASGNGSWGLRNSKDGAEWG